MSVEFEKVVLEKLKVLDELKVEVGNLSEKVDNNTALIGNLTDKVGKLEEKVDNLSKDVLDTQDIVKIQGQNLAKFEHECMLKLNTLLDSFVSNSESHAVFSKFIAQLNAESFNHKTRISKLEDYFNDAKLLATN